MKLLKIALLVLLVSGCANTDDVDDSDVQNDIANTQGEASESGDSFDEFDDIGADAAPAAAAPTSTAKSAVAGAHEAYGETAALLYNIASSALKKADSTLTYTMKCNYTIKPMTIKGCMVKTGYLPADAKAKVGKLLLEAKNLPRKKTGANVATVTTNYTCTKARNPADTVCYLNKAP